MYFVLFISLQEKLLLTRVLLIALLLMEHAFLLDPGECVCVYLLALYVHM